jgi:uncharacterized protein (UPF0303 family)
LIPKGGSRFSARIALKQKRVFERSGPGSRDENAAIESRKRRIATFRRLGRSSCRPVKSRRFLP